jgi:hypothetical protein
MSSAVRGGETTRPRPEAASPMAAGERYDALVISGEEGEGAVAVRERVLVCGARSEPDSRRDVD